MKIHEYQAKEILRKYGVPVPKGEVVDSAESARAAAVKLGSPVVVKSQIHAGGRGKGKLYAVGALLATPVLEGGVKVVKTPDQAKEIAGKILGNILVTHQTGPGGKVVKKILIEEGCAIERELYLGAVLDRANSRVTIMASAEGGVEIEEVAAKHPEKIFKMAIDPSVGVEEEKAEEMANKLGLSTETKVTSHESRVTSRDPRSTIHDPRRTSDAFVSFVKKLYEAYVKADCSLAEINPLVVAKKGDLLALDAKINFDDNALYRHPEYEAMRDLNEEDPAEIEAKKYDLSYISLDGTIGCMVNGAGLAMATMDIIKLHGGEPANFLDVGGGATAENVTAAFKIIMADPKVKAVLVNIFGGIMRCDVIAEGIVSAAKEVHIKVPVVVRLQGTNVDIGKRILNESGLSLISEDDLSKAAEKVVGGRW